MERAKQSIAVGFISPLRYPGGKRKLYPFFRDLIKTNSLTGAHYIEPFAGGAGLALALLVSGFVKVIHLNDLDPSIFTFWKVLLTNSDRLISKINNTPITISVWEKQREIIGNPAKYSDLDIAFATLFLNRTNRSGILMGGVIGGKNQNGKWKIDSRFNKVEIIRRIKKIADLRDKIRIYNEEATHFLSRINNRLPAFGKCLTYADPPYFSKGHTLYYNHFKLTDHEEFAQVIRGLECPRVVTYDDVDHIRLLYQGATLLRYQISYSAHKRRRNTELMFLYDLQLPERKNNNSWHPMYALES